MKSQSSRSGTVSSRNSVLWAAPSRARPIARHSDVRKAKEAAAERALTGPKDRSRGMLADCRAGRPWSEILDVFGVFFAFSSTVLVPGGFLHLSSFHLVLFPGASSPRVSVWAGRCLPMLVRYRPWPGPGPDLQPAA